MERLGIIQPGKTGDVIVVLPIAKWYYDLGYSVVWPVASEYIPLFDYIDYVTPIDIGGIDGGYDKSKEALRGVVNIIDLGIGFGRDESDWYTLNLPWNEWKYKEAKVPFEEQFNLQINRKIDKELELEKFVGDPKVDGYVVTHSVGSVWRVDFGIKNSIEVRSILGYTVFDWISIIKRAKKVYCIDSCVAHLVNQLRLAIGKRVFRPFDEYTGRPKYLAMSNIKWEK